MLLEKVNQQKKSIVIDKKCRMKLFLSSPKLVIKTNKFINKKEII